MNPFRLIAILEHADPTFKDLFYPGKLRCTIDDRIVHAIEEHWPAYFPTRKECRGKNWSLTIPESEPLHQPRRQTIEKLEGWKKFVRGTIAELRTYKADHSWERFQGICRSIPSLRPLLNDFKPLADFLIHEESIWPKYGGVTVGEEEFLKGQMRALLALGSPYQHADPERLRFLAAHKPAIEKIKMLGLVRYLCDRPLMALAILELTARRSKHSKHWLPLQHHIAAIIKAKSPLTFRKTWLEHAMQVSGATTKTGKPVRRKWARLLVGNDDLNAINAKAIEAHDWFHGKKLPSMESVRRAGRVVFKNSKLGESPAESEKHIWLLSWMVTLWLEKHFTEIDAEFKSDHRKINHYYSRFFHYLNVFLPLQGKKGADGRNARQP